MISTANDAVRMLWEYDLSSLDELVELKTGMEAYPNIDQDWVWLFKRQGRVVASLFAAPVHGVVFLLRLNTKGARPSDLRSLLRQALKSMQDRGYSMFFTMLDATRVEELKLARICERYGCQLVPYSGIIAVGKIK